MLGDFFTQWAKTEDGATLVEYGIAVVVAVIVGTGGLILMAEQINTNMNAAATEMAAPENQ